MSFFGKKEKEPATDAVAAAETALIEDNAAPRAETPVIALASSRGDQRTSIDSSIKVKGELLGDEDVTIDGRVEGIINLNKDLVVGKSGVVEADVRAASVVIHGRVTGNISADLKVEIHSTGRLEGNIKSPKIVIAEGAHFKGNVDMTAGSQGASMGVQEAAGKSLAFERKA